VTRSCPSCGKSYPDAVFFCGQDGTVTVQDQAAEDFDPRLGKRLGGYIAAARVADGAMGRVFEGRHPETRERVAIKVLHRDVARDAIAVERFRREFEAAREIPHRHVVKVLEFGDAPEGSFFLTMEFLEGQELAKALRADAPLAPARVVRIVCQIALALEHTHAFGYIHRDLKPDNVFLCRTPAGDDVRLLDFGSVKSQIETGQKLTAMGTTLGSPYYMSPEQAMGRADVDRQTDVFALGAVVYEMVTGHIAFEAPNIAKILVRIMKDEPPPATRFNPELPAGVDDVLARALAKDKGARFATVTEVAEALARAFGLRDGVEGLAATSEAEIGAAIAAAGLRDAATTPPPAPEHMFAATPSAASSDRSASRDAAPAPPSPEELAALAATAPAQRSEAPSASKGPVEASSPPRSEAPDGGAPRTPVPAAAALRARLAGAAEGKRGVKSGDGGNTPAPVVAQPVGSGAGSVPTAGNLAAPDEWTPAAREGFLRQLHPLALIGIGMVLGGIFVALVMR
jgi:serine/threonine-protein kinase